MDDDIPISSDVASDTPLSHQPEDTEPTEPDIMNDPMFEPSPIVRQLTHTSENGSEKVDTCRICRSEGTPDEPLFYPCKCSGSIKFVHQECLMEWLSHSHKKHCELCKTQFRFTKLYDANMPQKLPWDVFITRACWHVVQLVVHAARGILVGSVWLLFLPWLIRWTWRFMFWVADSAWAREDFIEAMRNSTQEVKSPDGSQDGLMSAFQRLFLQYAAPNGTEQTISTNFIDSLTKHLHVAANASTPPRSGFAWPQADPSILSSWTYLSTLTSSASANRLILDIFEGQLITCVVITAFILVFLIREWVVQQQPLVNLDNLNHAQQQIREAAERMALEHEERQRRQDQLLDQARLRLADLQNDTGETTEQPSTNNVLEDAPFLGWEAVEGMIDAATGHLRRGDEVGNLRFKLLASDVVRQIRSEAVPDAAEKLNEKLRSCSPEERREWLEVLVAETLEIENATRRLRGEPTVNESSREPRRHSTDSSNTRRRPPMPERVTSSRLVDVHRSLEESGTDSMQETSGTPETSSAQSPTVEPPTSISSQRPSRTQKRVSSHTSRSDACRPQLLDAKDMPTKTLPITNAGPDTKINIKPRYKGKKRRVEREPRIKESMITDDELMRRLEEEVSKEISNEDPNDIDELHVARELPNGHPLPSVPNDNPFHPDGPEPERRDGESFGNRVASVFREEFGLDEAEELENLRQTGLGPDGEPLPNDRDPEARPAQNPINAPPSLVQRVVDYFWGDIQVADPPEPEIVSNEERLQEEEDVQEAQFAPAQDNPPPIPFDQLPAQWQHDPEVVAAVQQAGINAEDIEDAEDLEGILELIGLQGPLIGLFQTSAFCTLLVATSIVAAVIIPYICGKAVLNIVEDPVYYLVQMPLLIASTMTDFIVDLSLMLAGCAAMLTALASDFLLSAVHAWLPWLATPRMLELSETIMNYSYATATKSGTRLIDMIPYLGLGEANTSWAFLRGSVHAHASLKSIEDEVTAVLSYTGAAVTWLAETISSRSLLEAGKQTFQATLELAELAAKLPARDLLRQYTQPTVEFFSNLKHGALTFSTSSANIDPSLVYWNSTDRALAIVAGYTAFAALAAVYVAMDKPITRSEAGRKNEKIVRDTLRQSGGVLKVILIISIEMLVFPLYCGMLLDLAFLPLFQGSSVATRWAFAGRKPYSFCFIHWFIGTCYMFHFALFVSMCRKILRKGVLWFIRDPDDPTFHPVRDVLERNVMTQLRKIAFSALVYGALVILCLGGVIWTIGQLFEGIFPIQWVSSEPIIEFPMDLLLYNFVTPLAIRLFKPSDSVGEAYAWWLRGCARELRLSHFLFGVRKSDEEGHTVHKFWKSFFLRKRAQPESSTDANEQAIASSDEDEGEDEDKDTDVPDYYFQSDGKYVLTPCTDQYRPPKPDEAFLEIDDNDIYIADKHGKRNEQFAKVYIPPWFSVRISLFMVCLWLFSAIVGLSTTLVPLVFGRRIFATFVSQSTRVNDIYAYSLGAYTLGGLLFLALKGKVAARYVGAKATSVNIRAWIEPIKRITAKTARCLYVYGFLGIVMPLIFATVLQFYIVLPLRTWAQFATTTEAAEATQSTNATDITPGLFTNTTQSTNLPPLADHTIHVLQDYALGLLYARIATRLIVAAPASRAAEAFRRIAADGYFNPNIRLATRFFVLPATLIATFVLLMPPLVMSIMITIFDTLAPQQLFDADTQTKLYRYSYPLAASCVVLAFGLSEVARATGRWRARIKDEVYLVGERLHNFGEKRPPVWSKSIIRKDK